jgi:hypothetical protein
MVLIGPAGPVQPEDDGPPLSDSDEYVLYRCMTEGCGHQRSDTFVPTEAKRKPGGAASSDVRYRRGIA